MHDRYGVAYGATESDPKAGPALDKIALTGIGWVRMELHWHEIEPQHGTFDWSVPDGLIACARGLGLEVLAMLNGCPPWASSVPAGTPNRHLYPPADYADWYAFVVEAVARYRADIDHWQCRNEPDLRMFWPSTPAEYARLLAMTWTSVKDADPAAQVVLGGLSMGGTAGNYNPDFLAEILDDPTHPAADFFDIADFHHYGSRAEATRRAQYVKGELYRVGASKPLWVTETGYASNPPYQQMANFKDGPAGQVRWMQLLVPWLFANGVDKLFWFTLFDSSKTGAQFSSHGLLKSDLTAKLALDAYAELIAAG